MLTQLDTAYNMDINLITFCYALSPLSD